MAALTFGSHFLHVSTASPTVNKNVLITGATSGFGKAMAERFAAEGCELTLAGRRTERLEDLARQLEAQHQRPVQTLTFDVRDKAAVKEQLGGWKERNRRLDLLINNAGLAAGLAPIQDGDTDDWDQMIDTNVKGLLYVTRELVDLMTAAGRGHIINIGSTASQQAYRNGNVYCATKFAVDALSQSMRIDLLPYGIRVTAIHPGMAETEFSLVRFRGDSERAAKVYEGLHPLTAADVADTAWYCAQLPEHVCINELVMTCRTQANAYYSIKDSELTKTA